MGQTTGRIIKSSDVQIEGRYRLDIEQNFQSGQNPDGASHAAHKIGAAPPMAAAKVKILENQSEFAVMEVTCCCGRKTIIRCDYGEKVCEPK
jgi:hypothetical protein